MGEVKYTKNSVIGDVVKSNEKAMEIIEKYFGSGCFTCPGMKMETIKFGATMHGVDPEKILAELNALS